MRSLKQLLMILIYLGITYCLLNFTLYGIILYVIGALIVWAENIKYDEIKISPLRIKYPLITSVLFLPILLVISIINFFLFLTIKD